VDAQLVTQTVSDLQPHSKETQTITQLINADYALHHAQVAKLMQQHALHV